MMEPSIDVDRNVPVDSNRKEKKKKCLTISEYNAMTDWIDSLIKDDKEFVLNKFGWLTQKALAEYSQLHENTVLSIVDIRVQHYVRQRHHKVFNNSSNTDSPVHCKPNQSSSHNQQRNKRMINSTSMYDRYKELAANDSVTSPLVTLANDLCMPAMLVAKVVLADHLCKEKSNQQHLNYSSDSNILNDNILYNDNDSSLTQSCNVNNSEVLEVDPLSSVDSQLSQQLNWLSGKLLSMQTTVAPDEVFNQSDNSSINSSSYSTSTVTKSLNSTPHSLATSTWLICTDPQLAYEVYKCSVIDGHYGSCIEFVKSCTGQRFEQLLKQRMCITTDYKSQTNEADSHSLYTTEKECRLRGLDMTPDMVLSEPIAISLCNDDIVEHDDDYVATNYIGGSNCEIRILNWIESKALFGAPEHLQTTMQRQLFPYWNRYGPGAVIYWFGHIIVNDKKDLDLRSSVSTGKSVINNKSAKNIKTHTKIDSTEVSDLNFWSKYCILMDGFPAHSRIIMHDHRNNNKKQSKTVVVK